MSHPLSFIPLLLYLPRSSSHPIHHSPSTPPHINPAQDQTNTYNPPIYLHRYKPISSSSQTAAQHTNTQSFTNLTRIPTYLPTYIPPYIHTHLLTNRPQLAKRSNSYHSPLDQSLTSPSAIRFQASSTHHFLIKQHILRLLLTTKTPAHRSPITNHQSPITKQQTFLGNEEGIKYLLTLI